MPNNAYVFSIFYYFAVLLISLANIILPLVIFNYSIKKYQVEKAAIKSGIKQAALFMLVVTGVILVLIVMLLLFGLFGLLVALFLSVLIIYLDFYVRYKGILKFGKTTDRNILGFSIGYSSFTAFVTGIFSIALLVSGFAAGQDQIADFFGIILRNPLYSELISDHFNLFALVMAFINSFISIIFSIGVGVYTTFHMMNYHRLGNINKGILMSILITLFLNFASSIRFLSIIFKVLFIIYVLKTFLKTRDLELDNSDYF